MRRPPFPWIPAFSGIATALRGPRKWMRTVGRRVLAYCTAALRRPRKRIKVGLS